MSLRIAIIYSGRGSNMLTLLDHIIAHPEKFELATLVCNIPTALGIERAQAKGFATHLIAHKDFASRDAFETALNAHLLEKNVDVVCLAGFMRLLTDRFVDAWAGRMINIHPSLLPHYKGLHTHERALADGALKHGCTVHYVVAEMDAGPIIVQRETDVLPGDTPDSLAARVLELEHEAYIEALNQIADKSKKNGPNTNASGP